MTMSEVIDFISRYASVSRAPVRTNTTVTSLQRTDEGYHVATSEGDFQCRCVVIASGACNVPQCPAASRRGARVDRTLHAVQLPQPCSAARRRRARRRCRRRPACSLPAEIHRSGRPVTLSVGEHVRLPRTYRGRDVLWWMESSGVWDQRYDQIDDITRARRLPSPQLVGTPERTHAGSQCAEQHGRRARRPSCPPCATAARCFPAGCEICSRSPISRWTACSTHSTSGPPDNRRNVSDVGQPERFEPTRVPASSRLQIDLRSGEIRSIVWATGFRPDYSWLHVPVLDEKGYLQHDGGVVSSPGMYALGLPVLRRRKSSFIHGVEDDARELVEHLAAYLGAGGSPTHSPSR